MRGTPIPAIMYDFWNQIIDFGSNIIMFKECSIVFGWLFKKRKKTSSKLGVFLIA
jgi:hypothetical protein